MKRFLVYSVYILVTAAIFVGVSYAQFGDLTEPPRLRDVEPLLVQMVYLIWALGGLLFTAVLMYIGFRYMTSGGDPQKKEEMKKRATNWIIGLLIFFGGYPVIITVYDVLGIGDTNSDCYEQISTPGFHFFFPEVCTDAQAGGSKYDVDVDCSTYDVQEMQQLVSRGNCCYNTGTTAYSAPTGEYICSASGVTIISLQANANGFCQQSENRSYSGSQDCSSVYNYQFTVDNHIERTK